MTIPQQVLFLAMPVDVPSLETALVNGWRYVRIPFDRVIDVHDGDWVDLNSVVYLPRYRCTWVNRELDRMGAVFYYRTDTDNVASIHRKVLRTVSGGRIVLQDLNVSHVDFVIGSHSPGRIEY